MNREFDRQAASLIGLRLSKVEYWDIRNFSDEPRTWHYGDWHQAVMGVSLGTDAGPAVHRPDEHRYPPRRRLHRSD